MIHRRTGDLAEGRAIVLQTIYHDMPAAGFDIRDPWVHSYLLMGKGSLLAFDELSSWKIELFGFPTLVERTFASVFREKAKFQEKTLPPCRIFRGIVRKKINNFDGLEFHTDAGS